MPTFEFTSPQGKTYEITGPEGATQEQAFQILQTQLGQTSTPQAVVAPRIPAVSQIPNEFPQATPGTAIPPPPQPAPSGGFLDSLKGAGETALTLGSGALAAPIGAARGVYESLTGGKAGTQEGVRQGQKKGGELAQDLTYAPRTAAGQEMTGRLGQFFKDAGLEALGGLGGELGAIGAGAKAARPVVATKAAQVANAIKDSPEAYMAANAAKAVGSAGSAVGTGARNLAGKALGFDKDALALAQKAKEYGIDIRPDMLSNNKVIKMMGEALEKVPLSGSKAEARQEAINRALIKEIGGDPKAKRLNAEVFDQAITKSGKEIGRIGEQYGVEIKPNIQTSLLNLVKDAKKFETGDVRKVVSAYVKEIRENSEKGLMDGTYFKKLNSKLGRQITNTSNGDLKNALGDVQQILHDALENSIPNHELAAWKTARTQYAKAKTLEPLVAKSTLGDISGPALLGQVTRDKAGKTRQAKGNGGGLGDLARIGQLIKEPGSSGTGERNLAYGLLGGTAYANPGAAAGIWSAANLYNRFGQLLIPPPPKP
ncbi:MAG: hypothetical protein V4621_07515 [Pseudomonadota bacterium]